MGEPYSNSATYFVMGPTGSGKSDLAIDLAVTTEGSVVNCDSVQVYRHLNIGTSKPSTEDFNKVPHLLFDFVEPPEVYTAGRFRRDVERLMNSEAASKSLWFTGGSGFYFQAIEKGMFDVPSIEAEVLDQVRERIDREGLESVFLELEKLDPETAERVGPTDSYRIHRALCVYLQTGRTLTSFRTEFAATKSQGLVSPQIKFAVSIDRDVLRERVRIRAERMLTRGLMEEVQSVVASGLKQWAPLSSVGYKECLSVLSGELENSELLSEITKNTMRLAKRQMTWLRRDQDIVWLEFSEGKEMLNKALDMIACRPAQR